jgi:hypothetical protein
MQRRGDSNPSWAFCPSLQGSFRILKIMKLSIGGYRPGHVTGEPWPLNPSPPLFLCPESSKNSPEILMEGRGFEPETSCPFLFPKNPLSL